MITELYRVRAARHRDGDRLRGRLQARQPRSEAATSIAFDVRRNKHGSIDMTFYRMRAKRLRQEAMIELAHSIREYGLGWLRGWRQSGSRRS